MIKDASAQETQEPRAGRRAVAGAAVKENPIVIPWVLEWPSRIGSEIPV
jgi:hypothetical protein